MPEAVGVVVSAGLATYAELDGGALGLEDLYDMLEIVSVDAYNRRLAQEPR